MSRVEILPHGRRLYVADGLAGRAYVLAETVTAARLVAPGAVPASNAQVGDFLRELASEPTNELRRRLRVSRQTLHHWRRRAGIPATPALVSCRFGAASILATIRSGASIAETARAAGCSASTVRRIARAAGIDAVPVRPYPPAEELLELARGKTWQDFAAALGRTERAARAWIAARPELARALRAVMVRRAPGRRKKC